MFSVIIFFLIIIWLWIYLPFLKSIFSELGYNPVPSCPKSAREWEDSLMRLNCNDTHKYHCAPYLTNQTKVYQLYELCYRSINVNKGKYFKSLLSKYFAQHFLASCIWNEITYASSQQFVVSKSACECTIKQTLYNFRLLCFN